MIKKELRNIYRQKRADLTAAECSKLDDLLLIQFQKAELPFVQTLLSYWPIEENNEPNAHLFTSYLEFVNPELIIAYPRTDIFIGEMEGIITTTETDFVLNEYNIFEPEDGNRIDPDMLDMILVPLLAVDQRGYRVGYGKGYYDRYLVNCRKDCVKVGFSYFEPVDAIGDKAEFDVPLDLCITPHSVYVF